MGCARHARRKMIKEKILAWLGKLDGRTIRIVAYMAASCLVLTLVAGLIVFQKRQGILDNLIESAKRQAKDRYNLELSIGDARFSGLKTVEIKDLRVKPSGGYQLLELKETSVSVRLWPLLRRKIKVEELLLRHGSLSLVKKDSLANYDFLFRNQPAPGGQNTTSSGKSVNLADAAAKVLESVFYKIPEQMELSDLLISYTDDSVAQQIAVPNAQIVSGELKSRLVLNQGDAVWFAEGRVKPDDEQLYVRLFGDGKKVELPVLHSKYGLTLRADTLEMDLMEVQRPSKGELKVHARCAVIGLDLEHWRIASNQIHLKHGFLDAAFVIGERSISLGEGSELKIGKATAKPYIKLTMGGSKRIEMGIHTPLLPAQDLFDAFPEGLFDNLEGIRLSGKLKYDLDFMLDMAEPDSVKLNAALTKQNFRINAWGRTDLGKINQVFSYTPHEEGKSVRTFLVGPANPNFTPLGSISPNLKNAVLTAEDPSFFSHQGFVEEAIRGSIAKNLKEKAFRRGGSTISMQLVKNVYLDREKTLGRKIEEMLMVWLIEQNRIVSKERMFEVYLNIIEWGRNVYGIGEASRYYFAKHPSELNVGESIYLASIVPKPKSSLYAFQYDGHLKPYLSGYFRLIGNLMARRGLTPADSSRYGFYQVMVREPLRPAMPAELTAADTLEQNTVEKEFEESQSLLKRLFGGDRKDEKEVP